MNQKRKTSVFGHMAFWLSLLLSLAMVLSYLGSIIKPVGLGIIPTYFALAFPFLLLLTLVWVVMLIGSLRWHLLLCLCAIGLNISQLKQLVSFDRPDKDREGAHIKTMSFNVNLFDRYGHQSSEKGRIREDILALLEEEQPDIICFQEYYDALPKQEIRNFLRQKVQVRHIIGHQTPKKTRWGSVIATRFPVIADSAMVFKDSRNTLTWADLLIDGDTVRVICFHLESIGLDHSDQAFYDEMSHANLEVKELSNGVSRFHRKLYRAFALRSEQVAVMCNIIDQSPYPVLCCGDLNDVPSSYAYHQVSERLKDAFVEKGFGLGTSYAGVYPSFRIDYIFYDAQWSCREFQTIRSSLSDHYPTMAIFQKEGQP